MGKLPNYKRIYKDMILLKYPQKKPLCENILKKSSITMLDVVKLNTLLFGSSDHELNGLNQKLKSYDRSTIFEILYYQQKNKLNNSQLARHFNLSRNTVAKWKKIFFQERKTIKNYQDS